MLPSVGTEDRFRLGLFDSCPWARYCASDLSANRNLATSCTGRTGRAEHGGELVAPDEGAVRRALPRHAQRPKSLQADHAVVRLTSAVAKFETAAREVITASGRRYVLMAPPERRSQECMAIRNSAAQLGLAGGIDVSVQFGRWAMPAAASAMGPQRTSAGVRFCPTLKALASHRLHRHPLQESSRQVFQP